MRDATDGRTSDVFWAIGRVALAIWAYEELARGTNGFRRVLGAVMLVVIVRQLADR